MDNNDILIRLRYALNITDLKMVELFRLAGREIAGPELEGIFRREGETGRVECEDSLMAKFLEGLVISRRVADGAEASAFKIVRPAEWIAPFPAQWVVGDGVDGEVPPLGVLLGGGERDVDFRD
jgi:hypothetical protein